MKIKELSKRVLGEGSYGTIYITHQDRIIKEDKDSTEGKLGDEIDNYEDIPTEFRRYVAKVLGIIKYRVNEDSSENLLVIEKLYDIYLRDVDDSMYNKISNILNLSHNYRKYHNDLYIEGDVLQNIAIDKDGNIKLYDLSEMSCNDEGKRKDSIFLKAIKPPPLPSPRSPQKHHTPPSPRSPQKHQPLLSRQTSTSSSSSSSSSSEEEEEEEDKPTTGFFGEQL